MCSACTTWNLSASCQSKSPLSSLGSSLCCRRPRHKPWRMWAQTPTLTAQIQTLTRVWCSTCSCLSKNYTVLRLPVTFSITFSRECLSRWLELSASLLELSKQSRRRSRRQIWSSASQLLTFCSVKLQKKATKFCKKPERRWKARCLLVLKISCLRKFSRRRWKRLLTWVWAKSRTIKIRPQNDFFNRIKDKMGTMNSWKISRRTIQCHKIRL